MNEAIAIMIVLLGASFGVGWIAWVVATNIRLTKTAKAQAEVQARLLEKFGSGRDLIEYMQTEAGRHFVEAVASERANPFGRILGAVQVGLILTLLGLAFLLMRMRVPDSPEELLMFGGSALAVGIGFLLSSIVSYGLSKSWGLFDRKSSIQK